MDLFAESQHFTQALGAAIVRVVPAVIAILIVAIFTRRKQAFILAGTLPTLIIPAIALFAWWYLGRLTLSFRDDPAQQAYDLVVSLLAGAMLGNAAFGLNQRFNPSRAVTVGTAIAGAAAIALMFRSGVQASDQLLHCEDANKNTAYVSIASAWFGAPTLQLRLGGVATDYELTQATDTQYEAVDKHTRQSTISLDRISGRLVSLGWGTPEAVAVLADMCVRNISPEECENRLMAQNEIVGGFLCTRGVENRECSHWINGSRIISQNIYVCRPTARKF